MTMRAAKNDKFMQKIVLKNRKISQPEKNFTPIKSNSGQDG